MSAKRHKHTWTALWWNFGPHGRQDVHVHSCFDHTDDRGSCGRVLVGEGRSCDGRPESHRRETLRG